MVGQLYKFNMICLIIKKNLSTGNLRSTKVYYQVKYFLLLPEEVFPLDKLMK